LPEKHKLKKELCYSTKICPTTFGFDYDAKKYEAPPPPPKL
jgi:hypothetical protein